MIYYYAEKDFHWRDVDNGYGFTHTLPVINNDVMRRVFEPKKDSVVYRYDSDNRCLIPVLIIEGKYNVSGRVSNFWHWYDINEDLTLGVKQSGYGGFFESPNQFNVKKSYDITTK